MPAFVFPALTVGEGYDLGEHRSQVRVALLAEGGAPALFDVRDHRPRGVEVLERQRRVLDDLGSPVSGVGVALDDAKLLELVDELRDRLP